MYLNRYQELAARTAKYGGTTHQAVEYNAFKLAAEAGEICQEVARANVNDYSVITPERKAKMGEELGDLLWHLSDLARLIGFDLETIARANISKVTTRKYGGKQGGEWG